MEEDIKDLEPEVNTFNSEIVIKDEFSRCSMRNIRNMSYSALVETKMLVM